MIRLKTNHICAWIAKYVGTYLFIPWQISVEMKMLTVYRMQNTGIKIFHGNIIISNQQSSTDVWCVVCTVHNAQMRRRLNIYDLQHHLFTEFISLEILPLRRGTLNRFSLTRNKLSSADNATSTERHLLCVICLVAVDVTCYTLAV